MILFSFSEEIRTPPKTGKLPPLNPVRAPDGVTGISCSEQYFSVFETCHTNYIALLKTKISH